jgi:hypothetical protein
MRFGCIHWAGPASSCFYSHLNAHIWEEAVTAAIVLTGGRSRTEAGVENGPGEVAQRIGKEVPDSKWILVLVDVFRGTRGAGELDGSRRVDGVEMVPGTGDGDGDETCKTRSLKNIDGDMLSDQEYQ